MILLTTNGGATCNCAARIYIFEISVMWSVTTPFSCRYQNSMFSLFCEEMTYATGVENIII